jgi:hypothetical protein
MPRRAVTQLQYQQEILGPDCWGAQLSLRDRMRPMLAALILLVEVMTIAGLDLHRD